MGAVAGTPRQSKEFLFDIAVDAELAIDSALQSNLHVR